MKKTIGFYGSLFLLVVFCSCKRETFSTNSSETDAAKASTAKGAAAAAAVWEAVIDGNSFANYNVFQSKWNYLYPWGKDHNGTARMYGSTTDHNHISLAGNVLTLLATKISWNEGNSGNLPIRYHSGAVHAKHQIMITDQFPNYEVRGDFQAPSVRGSWPAFWLTGASSWPPESDILEYKGNTTNWQNTARAWNDWSSTLTNVASPGSWHNYRVWMTKVSATDIDIHYYIDNVWKAAHRANFVNKPMWLIINLQMEGSSGEPGPTANTFYRARNVYVGRTKAF